MDRFNIISGDCSFAHASFKDQYDFVIDNISQAPGTTVIMALADNSKRTAEEIAWAIFSPDGMAHNLPVVTLLMAKHGNEALVSRSQAKLVLLRLEKFDTVLLDFQGIDKIGQGFADEVSRVFPDKHPNISLIPTNANAETAIMIESARQNWKNAALT